MSALYTPPIASLAKGELARRHISNGAVAARYDCSTVFARGVLNGRVKPPQRFIDLVAELTGLPGSQLFDLDNFEAAR